MLWPSLPATVAQPQWAPTPTTTLTPVVAPSPPIFTIREPDGVYYGPDQNCESGSTPLPAGLWIDPCYHGGTALLSHDWSYGAVFKQMHAGERFIFRGRTYTVTSVKAVTPEQQYWEFNAHAALLLMTCSGPLRWVVEAS